MNKLADGLVSRILLFAMLSGPQYASCMQPALKAKPAQPRLHLKTYSDSQDGVGFSYPAAWQEDPTIDFYLPTSILVADQGGRSARMKVGFEVGNEGHKGYDPYPRTNLAGVEFVYLMRSASESAECTSYVAKAVGGKVNYLMVNHTKMVHGIGWGGGLGHEDEFEVYGAFQAGRCYLFEAGIHTANTDDADRPISSLERAALRAELHSIMQSVRIAPRTHQPQPIDAPTLSLRAAPPGEPATRLLVTISNQRDTAIRFIAFPETQMFSFAAIDAKNVPVPCAPRGVPHGISNPIVTLQPGENYEKKLDLKEWNCHFVDQRRYAVQVKWDFDDITSKEATRSAVRVTSNTVMLRLSPKVAGNGFSGQEQSGPSSTAMRTFHDSKYGVTFKYPSNWQRRSGDPGGYGGSSLLLNPDGGYDPAIVYVEWVFRTHWKEQPDAGRVRFVYAVLPVRSEADCSKRVRRYTSGDNAEGLSPDRLTVNGIVFDHTKTENAATGQSWESDIYTTFRNRTCYGFDLGDEANHVARPTPPSADDEEASKQLDAILRTIWIGPKNSSDTSQRPSVVYTDRADGFTFRLPADWKGFSVVSSASKLYPPDTTSDVVKESKSPSLAYRIITLRHPLWTNSHPRQDIPILIFTIAQWKAEESGQLRYPTAAPVGPDELGRNSKYVFALPPRFTASDPEGVDEVLKIVESHPLHAF